MLVGLFSPHDPFGKFLAMIEYDPHEDDTGRGEEFRVYTRWVMDHPDWWPGWKAAGVTREEVLLDLATKADHVANYEVGTVSDKSDAKMMEEKAREYWSRRENFWVDEGG